MINDRERVRYLFNRYANNTCSRKEMEELFAIVRESRQSEDFNLLLQEAWNDIRPGEPVTLPGDEEMFRMAVGSPPAPVIHSAGFGWLRVAAVLFLLTCSAALIYYFLSPKAELKPAVAAVVNQSTKSAHKLITLPDGSTVLLNDHSSLDFPPNFSDGLREVTLHGEAYFDIVKDPSRPFIIHSGKLQTRVLGTAFNIRAYDYEPAVIVTVTRGKVKVEMENKILGIITPNQQISFNTATSKAVQQDVVAESAITWKQKDLVFDNITFPEAAAIIHERYGAEIQFANERLKNCRFTASFLNENPLEQVLKVICDLNKAAYSINNNKVVISGEGCP